MIRLINKGLSQDSINHLASIQELIDTETSFEQKVEKAKSKWDGKTGSIAGNRAFDEVKNKLNEMSVSNGLCVYCEQNEWSDIEHFYPKRLYPNKAFLFENYLPSCKQCNTTYKSDKFKIFDPIDSDNIKDVSGERKIYLQPSNEDAVLINQLKEDPMSFIELDLEYKTFVFTACDFENESSRSFKKANYTIELLQLNDRAVLVEQRKKAFDFYILKLNQYNRIKNATTKDEIADIIGNSLSDLTNDFDVERNLTMNNITAIIQSNVHPTVWKEIIRQRERFPLINSLFEQSPEALNW